MDTLVNSGWAIMELPELTVLAREMSTEIVGRVFSEVDVENPKCLNMPLDEFKNAIKGRYIRSVECRGKWLFIGLDSDRTLLFNPGMGVDIMHFERGGILPDRYHIRFGLDNGAGFTIRVWWFCYLHLMDSPRLGDHKLTACLGRSPLEKEFTLGYFKELLAGRGGNIKSFMLDQKNIAGIGNVYIQDILFNARLHPKRQISSITSEEREALFRSMVDILNRSIELGGLAYERDFYGNKGGYGHEQFKIAYKSGEHCPNCDEIIQKIKTGSTSSFICPNCQPLDSQKPART